MSFKTPQGNFLLKHLFFETTLADKSTVVYTLKDQDHEGYPSLRRLYLEIADPTEYTFALRYMDGWAHWERLCESSWFIPYIQRWRRELEVLVRSKALVRILETGASNGKESFLANKFLLTGSWKPTGTNRVGRPNKQEIIENVYDSKEFLDDIKRLSIEHSTVNQVKAISK